MQMYYAHWKDVPANEWHWSDFSPQEMACRGTGKLLVDHKAMDKLQALRTRLERPLIVNSAYRSPEHNKRVGGAPKSYHLKAVAYDISMANHNPSEFEAVAKALGFTGFGHYVTQNFMHIDTGKARRWTGSDKKWFPKSSATPDFQAEAKPDTIAKTLLKPEVLGPAGGVLSGGAAVAQGAGPVQYALAAVMVALVVVGIIVFVKRQSAQKPRD